MEKIKWARLPLQFDAELLREDLRRIEAHHCLEARPWTTHFNAADFRGDWSGISLRSPSGEPGDLYIPPATTEFADTEALRQSPHLRAVLEALDCPLRSVRLLRLRAGSAILEHTDDDLKFDLGEMRLHVPIQTNPQVEFVVAGRRLELREGECWYIDFSLPHRVHNRGSSDRIHLVIDGQVSDWARTVIASAARDPIAPPPAPERGAWESFRERVFEDPLLQARLKSVEPAEFVPLCVALGREHGFVFEASDVESALRSATMSWQESSKSAWRDPEEWA